MRPKFQYIVVLLISLLLWVGAAPPPQQEITCQEEYIIQADDWLSQIAAKFLGNPAAYPAIVTATNHRPEAAFAKISDPNRVEVGWKVCIPPVETAQALLAQSQAGPTGTLTVFAAASLTESFTEIAARFEADHPGAEVILNFAGSQQLAQQLGQGAPADVFASANTRQMQAAIQAGRIGADAPQVFAHNRLVVIYPTQNPAQITALADLAQPGLILILAAEEVPVGQYTRDFLDKAARSEMLGQAYRAQVLANVASFEATVKAVFSKVALGEGDAGIVYSSDISGENADRVSSLPIPDELNTIADYPIAPVSDTANPELARLFIDFVQGSQGQAILASYHFIPVEQAGESITVTDALERTTQFEPPPQRIAVAGKATFMVVNALFMFPEALNRVKTMPGGGQSMAGFLSLVDPNFADKPKFDDNPGPEQIAAVQPEAVVLKSFMADRLGQPLEQLGIPVVYVDLETIEQYSRDVNILGELFDNRERAEAINAFYRERLTRIDRAISGAEKPDVLLLQYSDRGGQVAFNVPSADWIQTDLVRRSGGEPVWLEAAQGGGWTVVGFEQIAAWEPDKIFVINYFGDANETVATLQADPRWQALAAVQAGELYAFPQDFYSWDQPDPRWILGLSWLAQKTHPDRLPDLDIMAEVDRFYQQLYGLDEAAIQESIIPKLGGD